MTSIEDDLRDMDSVARKAQHDAYYQGVQGQHVTQEGEGSGRGTDSDTAAAQGGGETGQGRMQGEEGSLAGTLSDGGAVTSGFYAPMHKEDLKAQNALNIALKARSTETVDTLQSFHDSLASFLATKAPQLNDKIRITEEALQDMEDRFRWSSPSGWRYSSFIDAFKLQTLEQEIKRLEKLGTPDISPVCSTLTELLTTKLTKGRIAQRRDRIRSMEPYGAQDLADVTMGLYEYLHVDVLQHVKDEVTRSDTTRRRLQQQIEHLQGLRDEAISKEDMVKAEQLHREMIENYVELVDLMSSRMDQLTLSANDTTSFRSGLDGLKRDADEAYGGFNKMQEMLLKKINGDIALCEEARVQEQANHEAALLAFAKGQQESFAALRSNHAQQQSVMEKMRNLAAELQGLGDEQMRLTHKHLQAKEDEEKRLSHFFDLCETQRRLSTSLENLKDIAETSSAAGVSFNDYNTKIQKMLQEREVEKDLEDLSLDEALEFLKIYRSCVFAVGDLHTRKQQRSDALHRQHRQAVHLRDSAVDSFDPNLKDYSLQLEGINNQLDECESGLAYLQSIFDSCRRQFTPTEELLLKHGKEFTHPMLEYADVATDKRRKYVQKAMEFVLEEEKETEQARENVARLKQMVEVEKSSVRNSASPGRASRTPQE